ncbi:MAG: tetratricopeptide repeat protein [Asgard group archaeon]|nr:tetratricopeptide repeat protein [Asgard group archaeon]
MGYSENIKILIKNGLKALKEGNAESAIKSFDEVIASDNENTIAWNYKGLALRKQGKFEEALKCYNKALEKDNTITLTLLNKARVLKLLKKFDLALFVYEDILELAPEHPIALDESESIKSLVARRAKLSHNEAEMKEQEKEEFELIKERKDELSHFLEESKNSINDSIIRIKEIYTDGIKEEAIEHRDKILEAIDSFNEELINRIKNIADDFYTLDFEEENRELIDSWEDFRDQKETELEELG